MERLDGLLGNMSGSWNRATDSEGANREPTVNFNENPNRGRSYGSARGRGNSSSNATGNNRPRGSTNTRGSYTDTRPISSKQPMRDMNANGRIGSTNWNHSNQGRSHPSDSDRMEIPEHQSVDKNDQAGHSLNATAMGKAFEPLNRSMETFTRFSRTSERSEKSRRVFKTPRCYKDESDGCYILG